MQSVLFVYNAPSKSLIVRLSNALSQNNENDAEVYKMLHELIALASINHYAYGNLWHNFLTYFILCDENIFSLLCERRKPCENSFRDLAFNDFKLFMKLYKLNHPALSYVCNFRGTERDLNSPILKISELLANSKTPEEFFSHIVNFYEDRGVGIFAFNRAFRFNDEIKMIVPVADENVGNVMLNDIIGYDAQKKELTDNTEAFVAGRTANNVLLYGDGGTGKSTSIKALLNEYYDRGLRVIEIYKHQFREILKITEILRKRNYKFIIFIDDLSFEENESEYKYLKAIIEGGIETRPENILIYATSNRRHIVREIWSDRDDMEHNGDIHRSDTVEEKLSLASRFGIAINYSAPSREIYHEIVISLAKKAGLKIEKEKLLAGADRWEIRHGGKTGRAARQYIDYLKGFEE